MAAMGLLPSLLPSLLPPLLPSLLPSLLPPLLPGGGGLQRTWLLTRPMAPLTGDISRVGAVHPETIGPHCLAMLPRSNFSSCRAATTLPVALHGRKARRAACVCTGTECTKMCQIYEMC